MSPQQRGYRAEPTHRVNTYGLASGMAMVSLFAVTPAWWHAELSIAPAWTCAAVVCALLLFAYAVWIALLPDWSTVWVGLIVSTAHATVYGLVVALVTITPRGQEIPLGLTPVRDSAQLWCLAVLLLSCAVAYGCGRISTTWYSRYAARNLRAHNEH
jgi:hypothetical protein